MQAARLPLQGDTSVGQLIHNSRQGDRSPVAHQPRRKLRKRRFLGIHFNQLVGRALLCALLFPKRRAEECSPYHAATGARPERPIDDVSKRRSRPDDDYDIASSSRKKIFDSLRFAPGQLFTEPLPNQLRITRERFRRGQLRRIKIPPVTALAAKRRDTALSRNAGPGQNENTHARNARCNGACVNSRKLSESGADSTVQYIAGKKIA